MRALENKKINLTNSEWNVMECLWENTPCTVMQAAAYLAEHVGWAKSTSITMLGRMEKKGIVRCETNGRTKQYFPLIKREDAVVNQTRSFLGRVYNGSIGMMMSTMVEKQELSKQEIDELYEILRKAEKKDD